MEKTKAIELASTIENLIEAKIDERLNPGEDYRRIEHINNCKESIISLLED